MSKLINCYHIKKKHLRREEKEEEEEEEEDEENEDDDDDDEPTTTCEIKTTKSNDCDIRNNNIDTNHLPLHCDYQHHDGLIIERRSPVAVSIITSADNWRWRRRPPSKGGNIGTNLAHQLLALVLMCLTLSCLHDDWLRWRQKQQLCMKNAQTINSPIFHNDDGTKQLQQQPSPCDDWPVSQQQQPIPLLLLQLAEANVDANRLYEDLMMTYNRIVLPVQNNTDRVVVQLGLKLSQLIDVNLKNQMMTTNVWLNQGWMDYKLKWDPGEYGGIEDINLPAEQIWLPDIVLYNSAEGYFAVSIMTKAKVRYDGYVTWNPPAIFRSSCQIDITYFPFDSQNCHLKFGSWTFGNKIDLRHINDTEQSIEYGTDLSEYYQNVEWDIMRATAKRNVITYTCCPNDHYPDVTFNFTLRRKPLFYTVNLILPCIGITILSFLVFYLPSDSGEKVTLTISILVSLIFFLCVLIETIPSTSTAMPLLGKYLCFTMILITLSVCATVGVLNIHFRTPSTHSMSPWAKRWCIDILPKYLFMNVPQYQTQPADSSPILPEQLIYPHNQAYQQSLITNWSSLVQEAQKQQQQQQQQLSSQQHQQQHHNNQGSSTVLAKQDKQANEGQPIQRPTMQLLDISKLSHQSSTSSSFLPYLTSEAARRLQMQRSRSSERASSNNCDSAANSNSNSNNNNINSNHIGARQTVANNCDTAPTMEQVETSQVNRGRDANNDTRRRSSSSGGKLNKKSSPFWRIFGKGSSNKDSIETTNTIESRIDSQQQQQRQNRKLSTSTNQASTNRIVGPAGGSSTSSSSESEHNYQHHNHFQARASICSTNMWRIGPTRRCSLAATASGQTNYATFYRPLAHLNSSSNNNNNNKSHQQVVSTISGGRANLMHQHSNSGDQFDSAGSSESPLMGGFKSAVSALASAAVTNLPTRTKAISQLHGQQQQQPNRFVSALARHHQVHPQAAGRGADEQEMRQLPNQSLAHSRQPANNQLLPMGLGYGPHLQHPTPPPPLPPDLYFHEQQLAASIGGGGGGGQSYHPVVAINRLPAYGTKQQQLYPDPQRARDQHLVARQHSSGSNQSGGYHTASLETASSTTATTVMVLGDRQQSQPPSQQQQQQQQQFLNIHPYLHSYHQPEPHLQPQPRPQPQQQQQQQYMTRSHSTDHRLCQYALASSGDQQPSRQAPTISAAGQRHTIGRALGQVYVQRLQRQPTIYSLQPTMFSSPGTQARQSRSIYRNAAQLMDPMMMTTTAVHSNDECIRRSKSQTSLNHQHQHQHQHQNQNQQVYRPTLVSTCRQCNQQRQWANRDGCGNRAATIRPNSSCHTSTGNRQRACNCSAGTFVAPPHPHPHHHHQERSVANSNSNNNKSPMSPLGFMKLISEVDKAIQNAMFIAQHIDNLDEFESVKENWKYIAMVIDRIFLIVFLFACIVGSTAIFMMVPWSHYTVDQPIDLQLVRSMSLNFTAGEPHPRSCRDDF